MNYLITAIICVNLVWSGSFDKGFIGAQKGITSYYTNCYVMGETNSCDQTSTFAPAVKFFLMSNDANNLFMAIAFCDAVYTGSWEVDHYIYFDIEPNNDFTGGGNEWDYRYKIDFVRKNVPSNRSMLMSLEKWTGRKWEFQWETYPRTEGAGLQYAPEFDLNNSTNQYTSGDAPEGSQLLPDIVLGSVRLFESDFIEFKVPFASQPSYVKWKWEGLKQDLPEFSNAATYEWSTVFAPIVIDGFSDDWWWQNPPAKGKVITVNGTSIRTGTNEEIGTIGDLASSVPNPAPPGKLFSHWESSLGNVSESNAFFTRIQSTPVTVTAVYEDIPLPCAIGDCKENPLPLDLGGTVVFSQTAKWVKLNNPGVASFHLQINNTGQMFDIDGNICGTPFDTNGSQWYAAFDGPQGCDLLYLNPGLTGFSVSINGGWW